MEARGYGNQGGLTVEVRTIRAIYDAFARRDVEAALAHVSEDVEFFPRGTAELVGRQEPYRGHDGIREYFADAERLWEDLTLHADDMRTVMGSVVVFGHVDGRVEGRNVRRRVIWNWQVRDGKAVSMRISDLGDATER